jgi:hypothetical protein
LTLRPSDRGGDVDQSVEGSSRKCINVAFAIAAELLEIREELRVVPAAVEERHVVPGGDCSLDDMPSEKNGTSENENPHEAASSSSMAEKSCEGRSGRWWTLRGRRKRQPALPSVFGQLPSVARGLRIGLSSASLRVLDLRWVAVGCDRSVRGGWRRPF